MHCSQVARSELHLNAVLGNLFCYRHRSGVVHQQVQLRSLLQFAFLSLFRVPDKRNAEDLPRRTSLLSPGYCMRFTPSHAASGDNGKQLHLLSSPLIQI